MTEEDPRVVAFRKVQREASMSLEDLARIVQNSNRTTLVARPAEPPKPQTMPEWMQKAFKGGEK